MYIISMHSEESKKKNIQKASVIKEKPNVKRKKEMRGAIQVGHVWKRYVSFLSYDESYRKQSHLKTAIIKVSYESSTLSYVDSRRGRGARIPFCILWLLSCITPFSESSSSDSRGREDSSFRTCSRGRCSSRILSGICGKWIHKRLWHWIRKHIYMYMRGEIRPCEWNGEGTRTGKRTK